MRTALLLCSLVACKGGGRKHEQPPPPAPTAHPTNIPKVDLHFDLDGELHEPPWNQIAFRAVLTGDDGQQARPYSELRLLHDAKNLYLGLYAADEDIRSTDAWDLVIGTRKLHIDATGKNDGGLQVGVDRDGSLDHPEDYDEEWVIETAIPLDTIGPPPLAITAARCDTTKDGEKRCGQWKGSLELAP
jgi:hypothetical protein